MDDSTFDRIARTLGADGTRRRLLGALTGLALGGILAVLETDEAGAEKPKDRLQRRTKQRRRKRRNEKRRHQKNGNSGGGGGLGSDQCVATGGDCNQDSDCCTSNCFNFECASTVHQCSAGGTTIPCRPPAKGCAGDQCCRGPLSCNDGCCGEGANQCNAQGNCCVPNCAGRQCGDDGCGSGGTCGACPTGTTCDEVTGRCPQPGCDVCPTCRYTTIQAAVDDANGLTTIHICPGVYTESLYITRSLSLIGAGQGNGAGDTVLSWPEQGGVVVINGEVDVTLQSLRVTDGIDGGIDFNSNQGALTVTDCTVTANNNSNAASAFQASGTLIMTGCTISDNYVTGDSVFGGGIYYSYSGQGRATLTNCVVSGNTANGTDLTRTGGGGIYFSGPTVLTLNNTRVTGNSTTGPGGGIYVETNGGSVVLENGSVVSGNTPDDCNGC